MLKYIDIHAHVNFKVFDEDHDAVIRRALDNDTWFFNVGTLSFTLACNGFGLGEGGDFHHKC